MSQNRKDRWHKKLIEQYLNTFFRETKVDIQKFIVTPTALPALIKAIACEGQFWFSYRFPTTGVTIAGDIEHLSLSGYHKYGCKIFLIQDDTQHPVPLSDIDHLLSLITGELAGTADGTQTHRDAAEMLLGKMRNSIDKSRFFLKHSPAGTDKPSVVDDFIAAEQGMILGHPFHITSKASSGFSKEDMKRFSPELGTSFQLHYFAVVPELMETISSGVRIEDLLDPAASQQAVKMLGEEAKQYQLIPCHPWQTDYLLNNDTVKQQIDRKAIIHLGAIGEIVFPTSSVRTVWMPKCRQFLKLSLDVRITNFIRNNPADQRRRAIDVSHVLNHLEPQDLDPGIVLLPEHIAQTIRLPELEASFGILYRAGLSDDTQADTRILGSLVEECLDSGELPLFRYIEQAAKTDKKQITADFILYWWRKYTAVSLIPTLKLFADLGISLEAHLQNSLMQFKGGFPARLIVRDMEGASITKETASASHCKTIHTDSPVWYKTDECWFRFQYYVVVNHIAHVIAAIARQGIATEQQLWQATKDVLIAAQLSPSARVYADKLLNTRFLPAKANMLSTFSLRGETPCWVDIANPLALDRSTALVPMGITDAETAFRQAETRVINQLLESLLFEQVLEFTFGDNYLCIPVSQNVRYRCEAVRSTSFERVRILSNSLRRIEADQISAPSLQQVLCDVSQLIDTAAERWADFSQELIETLAKHTQSLQNPPCKPLREMDYFEQEARVNNGHLYHPSFKARTGFDLDDNRIYGPELSSGLSIVWVAVTHDLADITLGNATSLERLYSQQFTAIEYQRIQKQIHDAGRKLSDYVLLPVHPWQWQHIIAIHYHNLIVNGTIMRLDIEGPCYLPQQSIRTLSNIRDISLSSIKLAINMGNTSTSRILAPHTVKNCAPISDWLTKLVQDDPLLPKTQKPIILREYAGVSVAPPTPIPTQYGTLACIWRDSVYHHLTPQQDATPLTAVMQIDSDADPVIAPWIQQYGAEQWLSALLRSTYIPVLHMLWYHGVALESHAQNMVLVHEDGMPVRVMLKDFHDGVRYSKEWLREPQFLPELTEAPEAHKRINPNSFLETDDANELRDFTLDALGFVNLAELSWFMQIHFDLPETRFWQIAVNIVEDYQSTYPQLAERFARFNIFDEQIQVEQLASRRFMPEIRLRVMSVVNPLAAARQINATSLQERLQ